jgi:hypothetical protein
MHQNLSCLKHREIKFRIEFWVIVLAICNVRAIDAVILGAKFYQILKED